MRKDTAVTYLTDVYPEQAKLRKKLAMTRLVPSRQFYIYIGIATEKVHKNLTSVTGGTITYLWHIFYFSSKTIAT